MHEIRQERVRANGLSFHVHVCGDGDRLALCLHGFPELGYSWRHQLPLLASLGFRAWAPDLRGYGQTDRPTGLEPYAIEHLVQDVASLIDASGARETTLLAHDWGAMIAWQLACHRIRPLERLIVMNGPPPGVRQSGVRGPAGQLARQIVRSSYVLFFQLPWLPELALRSHNYEGIGQTFTGRMTGRKERFPSEVVRVYREAAAQPGALTAMLNYYRGILRGGGMRRIVARGFPAIETPTLLIWGREDPVLVPSVLDGADQYLKDLTLRILPGVGHWVQQEAPEIVNGMLEAWLRGEEVSEAPTESSFAPPVPGS